MRRSRKPTAITKVVDVIYKNSTPEQRKYFCRLPSTFLIDGLENNMHATKVPLAMLYTYFVAGVVLFPAIAFKVHTWSLAAAGAQGMDPTRLRHLANHSEIDPTYGPQLVRYVRTRPSLLANVPLVQLLVQLLRRHTALATHIQGSEETGPFSKRLWKRYRDALGPRITQLVGQPLARIKRSCDQLPADLVVELSPELKEFFSMPDHVTYHHLDGRQAYEIAYHVGRKRIRKG